MSLVFLYAVRLDDVVLTKKRFMDANPGYVRGKPCYYVGSSIYPPAVRFEKHKNGERSSRWVREFGLYVAGKTGRQVEVSSAPERDAAERAYARELREKGYGIWQN